MDEITLTRDEHGFVTEQKSFKNGKLDGLQLIYDQSQGMVAMLQRSQYWRDGLRHGQCRTYKNGILVKEENFVNGKRHGIVYEYKNRKISKHIVYKDGLKHGQTTKYSDNGAVVYTANYVHDKLDGHFTMYWSNHHILTDVSFKQGLVHGEVTMRYESGRLARSCEYHFGQQKMAKYWLENGQQCEPSTLMHMLDISLWVSNTIHDRLGDVKKE